MKAIPISPVIIKVMPMPLNGLGTLLKSNRSLMAARHVIANSHPMPDPAPYTVAVNALGNSLCCMNKTAPNIAQFTAINGKNIPNELYREGEYFSITISRICTSAAITAINIIKPRNDRSVEAYSSPSQLSAPGRRIYWFMHQVIGRDTKRTKVTAIPRPNAVFTFFDTAR